MKKIMVMAGCIIMLLMGIGVKVQINNKNSNLEKQRTAAIGVKEVQPEVEEIRFIEDGSIDGGGAWSVDAKLKINNKIYNEILTKNGLGAGDNLPEGNTGTRIPVEVLYSNGQEETLK